MSDKIEFPLSWQGFCPICRNHTKFTAYGENFRDLLICNSCPEGSVPRERALMMTLESEIPNWRCLSIHESSPGERGVSPVLARECPQYVTSQFWTDTPLGEYRGKVRCENIEKQTFEENIFDIVITQDVMEHIFDPAAAYSDIYRTIKPGGLYIHTTPIYSEIKNTTWKARFGSDGTIEYNGEPEYHGNPIDENGSLVTYHYGYDVHNLIESWTEFSVEVRRFSDKKHGISGPMTEVIICRKHHY